MVSADPWSVTTAQLARWLSNPDWGPQTTRCARSSVRGFYRWAVLEERIDVSPAERLDSIRVPRALPRPLPDGPLRAALAAADDRMRLILMLGALGGLRRAEIANLHTRDVTEAEIRVVGKGGHHRVIPMHPVLWEAISVELERRRQGRPGSGFGRATETGYLFPSDLTLSPLTPAHVGVIVSRALPASWTTHSLRHRFATMSYAEQRDLLAVQRLLGHSKPETTSVYAAVPDGALRTAVLGATL
jgi:integrase/recombinase XerC